MTDARSGGNRSMEPGSTQAIDRLKSDLHALRHDLEVAAQTFNELGNATAERALAQARAQIDDIRAQFDAMVDNARAYGERSAEAVRQHVQHQPIASLAIAAAAGFVLAHLLARR